MLPVIKKRKLQTLFDEIQIIELEVLKTSLFSVYTKEYTLLYLPSSLTRMLKHLYNAWTQKN